MPDETETLHHSCDQQIKDLELRLIKQVDDLRKDYDLFKKNMNEEIAALKKQQEEMAEEIGVKVVTAFQKNFVDKYVPIEAYEERNKTKLAEGRYKFVLGMGAGVLILSVFLAIFSLTL